MEEGNVYALFIFTSQPFRVYWLFINLIIVLYMSNVLATQEAKYFPSPKVPFYCWKAIHLRAMLASLEISSYWLLYKKEL